MTRTSALLAALLLAPLALSAASAARDALDVPPIRLGDRYLFAVDASFSETERATGAPSGYDLLPYTGAYKVLIVIEGRATARDAFGVERDAVSFLIQRYRPTEVLSTERCYAVPGVGETHRWDFLAGGPAQRSEWEMYGTELPVVGNRGFFENVTPQTLYQRAPCDGYASTPTMGFAEGASYAYGAVVVPLSDIGYPGAVSVSEPAVATSHEGRRALDVRFPIRANDGAYSAAGEFALRIAEGVPLPVVIRLDSTERDDVYERSFRTTARLVGFEAGTVAYPDASGAPRETRNPWAPRAALPPRSADVGLALPFRYQEAIDAARAEAGVGLERWLAEHPDAGLVHAVYDRETAAAAGGLLLDGRLEGDGDWEMCFSDRTASKCVGVTRMRGAASPAGPLAGPASVTRASDRGEGPSFGWPASGNVDVISPDAIRRLLAEAGIPEASIRGFQISIGEYVEGAPSVGITVSQVSPRSTSSASVRGLVADIDLVSGGLTSVASTQRTSADSGLLAATPRAVGDASSPSAFSVLVGDLPGLGVAGAAATGIALFLVFLKFLVVPLFTRLVRARILDNPVRARIYERIRAEPGLHLAELEDFSGIGKGATKHHVDKLAHHKLVFTIEEAGRVLLFAAGEVPPHVARHSAILRAGSNARVYEAFATRPDASLREVARELGLSAPSVYRAKKRLEREGLLPAASTVVVVGRS